MGRAFAQLRGSLREDTHQLRKALILFHFAGKNPPWHKCCDKVLPLFPPRMQNFGSILLSTFTTHCMSDRFSSLLLLSLLLLSGESRWVALLHVIFTPFFLSFSSFFFQMAEKVFQHVTSHFDGLLRLLHTILCVLTVDFQQDGIFNF